MGLEFVRRYGAVLVLGAAFSGCGQPGAPTEPSPSSTQSSGASAVRGSQTPGSGTATARGAATPEDLIAKLDAATAAGDAEALASLFAPPGDAIIREKLKVKRDVRDRLTAVEKEITAKFGASPHTDNLPFDSLLAERVIQIAFTPGLLPPNRKNPRTRIVSKEAEADSLMTLSVETTMDVGGEPRVENGAVKVIQTADGWKFIPPPGDVKVGELPEDLALLIDQIEGVRADVAADEFQTRAEAEELMAFFLVSYIPSVLTETEVDPAMKRDAERLHLIPAAPVEFDGPPLTLVVSSVDGGDHAHLSAGGQEKEIPIDEIEKQVTELALGLNMPPGYPVRVEFRKGIRKDWIVGTLHSLVGLRTAPLQPTIGLAVEDSDAFLPLMNDAKGRLKLLFLYPPKYESASRLDLKELMPESPRLEDAVDELKSVLEKEESPAVEVFQLPATENGVGDPNFPESPLKLESIEDLTPEQAAGGTTEK